MEECLWAVLEEVRLCKGSQLHEEQLHANSMT